jgi:hypothetical protein
VADAIALDDRIGLCESSSAVSTHVREDEMMEQNTSLVLSSGRSLGRRFGEMVVLTACGLTIGTSMTGCAWWPHEEPQKPRTVTEWMKQPRVEP